MIIHLKHKTNKTRRSVFFTPVEDFLLSKLIDHANSYFKGKTDYHSLLKIGFDLDGKNYTLFPEANETDNNHTLYHLFLLAGLHWQGPDWKKSPVIYKLLEQHLKLSNIQKLHQQKEIQNRNSVEKLRPDYLDRLENGRKAIIREIESINEIIDEYKTIENDFYTYESLKKNLLKLKDEIKTQTGQQSEIANNHTRAIEQFKLLEDPGELTEQKRSEYGKLKEEIFNLISKEDIAKEQMVELDEELSNTNEQGIDYIQKLESIEKRILNYDQKMIQLEDSLIPQHVVKRVEQLNELFDIYFQRLEKLKFFAKQITDLEAVVNEMRIEQKSISNNIDLSSNIENIKKEINEINNQLSNLKGREESFIEGKKLLADNVCPIIGTTCTTIDEPVEEFFEKKISALMVEQKNLTDVQIEKQKTLEVKEIEQEEYLKWQKIQTKIYQSLDFIRNAIIDFQKEEDDFSNIPLGDKTLAIIELLEGLIPDQYRSSLQKKFTELGAYNGESDLVRRVELYEKRGKNLKESWHETNSKFLSVVAERQTEVEKLNREKSALIGEKEQLSKEYGLICRQVESIEKRRKDLSKMLFEAGKIKQKKDYLKQLEDEINTLEEKKRQIIDLNQNIKKLAEKLKFTDQNIKNMKETEAKYAGEYKILKRKISKSNKEEIATKHKSFIIKFETLNSELKRIESKITSIENKNRDIDLKNQNNMEDLFHTTDQKTGNNDNDMNEGIEEEINKILEKTDIISEIQRIEYLRRFNKKMPEYFQKSLEKISKMHSLLKQTFWLDSPNIGVVLNEDEFFWWREIADEKENLLLMGPQKLQKTASIYEWYHS